MNLNKYKVAELRKIAEALGITDTNLFTKSELVEEIFDCDADDIVKAIDAALGSSEEDEVKPKAKKKKPVREKSDAPQLDFGGFISEAIHNGIAEAMAELEVPTAAPREIKIVENKKVRELGEEVLPEDFDTILELASQRINTLMVGPSGCGKTFIGSKVAEALDLPFSSVSCSAGMSESQVSGWLLPLGDNGQFTYVSAPFVEAYENGGVFLLDEIDAADQNMLVFLNSAISNGEFYIPQRTENPKAVRHEDFVLLAAANTFGNGADMQYVGRNQLDAATLDRFRVGMVLMDYSDTVEEALIPADILEWGRNIREGIYEHGIRRIMSTRTMLDLAKMAAAYPNKKWAKRKQWDKQYFADWAEDERHLLNA